MKDLILNEKKNLNAVLVGLITPDQSEEKVNEYLDELAFLAETAGIVPGKRFIQRLDMPNSVTFVGKGKLQEIKEYIANNEEKKIDIIIFDDELSPRQIRNIEKNSTSAFWTEPVLFSVFLPCEQNGSCQSTSRASPIPVFIAATNTHVDAP